MKSGVRCVGILVRIVALASGKSKYKEPVQRRREGRKREREENLCLGPPSIPRLSMCELTITRHETQNNLDYQI